MQTHLHAVTLPNVGKQNAGAMVLFAAGLHNGDVATKIKPAVEHLNEETRTALDKDPAATVTPDGQEPDRANDKRMAVQSPIKSGGCVADLG